MMAKFLAVFYPAPQAAGQGVLAAMSHNTLTAYPVPLTIHRSTGAVFLIEFDIDTICF